MRAEPAKCSAGPDAVEDVDVEKEQKRFTFKLATMAQTSMGLPPFSFASLTLLLAHIVHTPGRPAPSQRMRVAKFCVQRFNLIQKL